MSPVKDMYAFHPHYQVYNNNNNNATPTSSSSTSSVSDPSTSEPLQYFRGLVSGSAQTGSSSGNIQPDYAQILFEPDFSLTGTEELYLPSDLFGGKRWHMLMCACLCVWCV